MKNGWYMRNNLQKIRWEKNLTLQQVSVASNVSVSELSKIENMETVDIYLSTAYKIAKALNVSLEELFPY